MKCILIPAVLFVVALCCLRSPAAGPALQQGDYVAVIGDSITEQRLYSLFIEDYLLMCKPAADLRATQFGWGGETALGFAARMANDCLRFQPSVATTCFGMNDGGYSPMDPGKARRYRTAQIAIVNQLKRAGVRLIVVGSPGCVDADTFWGHSPDRAAMYNKTLAELRDIARDIAREQGVVYTDVYDPMMSAMTKAKAKYGRKYHLAGGDGVHPDRNGHLVMAYAFLKALGCDGNIGTITVDLQGGKAETSEGHKILGCDKGQVEVESSKYPFCFYGDPAADQLDPRRAGVHPLQRRPEPADARRPRREEREAPRDLGRRGKGIPGRKARQGDQPGGGVLGQSVQRDVSRRRAEDRPAAGNGGQSGKEPDSQPAAVRACRSGRARGIGAGRGRAGQEGQGRPRRLGRRGGAGEARDQDRGDVTVGHVDSGRPSGLRIVVHRAIGRVG